MSLTPIKFSGAGENWRLISDMIRMFSFVTGTVTPTSAKLDFSVADNSQYIPLLEDI